jgi:hypothetical protein
LFPPSAKGNATQRITTQQAYTDMPGGTMHGGCEEDPGRTKHWWSDSSDDNKSYDEGDDDGGTEPAYQHPPDPTSGGGGDELLSPSSLTDTAATISITTAEFNTSPTNYDRHKALHLIASLMEESDDDKSFDEGGDDGGVESAYPSPPTGAGGGNELHSPTSSAPDQDVAWSYPPSPPARSRITWSLPETTAEHDQSTITYITDHGHNGLIGCLTGIETFVHFCQRWTHHGDAPDAPDAPDQESETTVDGGTEDFDDETKDTSVGSKRYPEMKIVVQFVVLFVIVLFLCTIYKVKNN